MDDYTSQLTVEDVERTLLDLHAMGYVQVVGDSLQLTPTFNLRYAAALEMTQQSSGSSARENAIDALTILLLHDDPNGSTLDTLLLRANCILLVQRESYQPEPAAK